MTNLIVSLNGVKALPTRALNLDPILSNAFQLVFAKVPNAAVFMQDFNLPGLSIAPVIQSSRFPDVKQMGEKLVYEPLTMDFLVDAQLVNYKEIAAWMKRITVTDKQRDEVDTATLIVNGTQQVLFHNVWPSSLGMLNFTMNPTDAPTITCSVAFEYDYWEFI